MTCRRCTRDRAADLMHFHNDVLQGWFCSLCADELIDRFVADAMETAREANDIKSATRVFLSGELR